jgi:hypothetical protein
VNLSFSAPDLEKKVGYHQCVGTIQVFLQLDHQLIKLRFSDQLLLQNAVAHVLQEVQKDRAPVVAMRIYVNQRINFDIEQTRLPEQVMRSMADKEVYPVGGRISFEDVEKTIPGLTWRIAEM